MNNSNIGSSYIFTLLMLINTTLLTYGQSQPDSLKRKHSPKIAATLSAVVPGLGQAYNKKYWKIPVVYAGMGGLAYLTIRNNNYYQAFKKAYKELSETNPNGYYYMYNTTFTLSGLDAGKNYYRRYRDMYAIFTVGMYVLNIVDAAVDAHFFYFDVNDNLSFIVKPEINYLTINSEAYTGIKICVNLKK